MRLKVGILRMSPTPGDPTMSRQSLLDYWRIGRNSRSVLRGLSTAAGVTSVSTISPHDHRFAFFRFTPRLLHPGDSRNYRVASTGCACLQYLNSRTAVDNHDRLLNGDSNIQTDRCAPCLVGVKGVSPRQ